jgi:hypothetical protein
MINFSPFFPGSGVFVTAAGFAPSFSREGVAAHNTPRLIKSKIERMRQMRNDLLNFNSIAPPEIKNLFHPLTMRLFHQNFKKI